MVVPEMANLSCVCVCVRLGGVIFSCQEDGAPSCRHQVAPDLEGRLEPGKREPVQTPILDSKQPLLTDKYGLQLARRYLSQLSASLGRSGVFYHAGIRPMGAYFWLKHN